MANNNWKYGGTMTFATTEAQHVTDISIACNKIMIQPHEDNKKPIFIGSNSSVSTSWVAWNANDIFIENVNNVKDIFVVPTEAGLKARWQVAD